MTGPRWTGRLTPGGDPTNPKAYVGVVPIAGFPYRIKVERDWREEHPTLIVTVQIEDGPKK